MRYLLTFLFLYFTATPQKVLFIGDSLTAYENGWQDVVCRDLKYNCTNLSKGGMKTDWMLTTLTTHLKKKHNYNQIVIYGGINDIFSQIDAESTLKNIQKMVDVCKSYNIEPVVIVGYEGSKLIHNTWIKDKNLEKKIKDEYIKYQSLLMLNVKGAKVISTILLTIKDSDDGIHLNAAGHEKFGKAIAKKL